MTTPPSRKSEPGGCPRCGVRLADPFKYCPSCAYRLRPELGPHTTALAPEATSGRRLLAVSGLLIVGSLLLLVVLAGVRLFTEPEVLRGVATQVGVARDSDAIPLTRKSFRRVEGGTAIWGVHDPAAHVPATLDQSLVDDPFDLCIHETSNDQYFVFLEARAERNGQPLPWRLYPIGWSRPTGRRDVRVLYDEGRGNEPVTGVDYWAALEFCAWFWEEHCQRNPNLVVDLPTPDEYVLVARDRADVNFPWEDPDEQDSQENVRANFGGDPLPVNAPEVGRYRDFFGLVGNAAEWVHGPYAAGWSYEDSDKIRLWELHSNEPALDKETPFTDRGFDPVRGGSPRPDLGFRVLIRYAREIPRFSTVSAGPVRFRVPEVGALPPFREPGPDIDESEEIEDPRLPGVSFAEDELGVGEAFEIARGEITNRQYLAFVVDRAQSAGRVQITALLPASFNRPHPFYHDPDDPPIAVFRGPFGDVARIDYVYEGGADNHPVRGVSPEQAEAYAQWLSRRLEDVSRRCRLPTVSEYLRAGREDRTDAYPPGVGPLSPGLVCAGRADDEGRAVSLAGRLDGDAPPVFGLVGNLPELVRDDRSDRVYLAGGFFALPAEFCTLDHFLDADWEYVEWARTKPDEGYRQERFKLAYYAGFRVVRTKVGF